MVYQRIKGDIMKIQNRFSYILSTTNALVGDYLFKCNNRKNVADFSRDGKMGFKETVFFMLNMVKKSLQVELNNFFETVLNKEFFLQNKLIQKRGKRSNPRYLLN